MTIHHVKPYRRAWFKHLLRLEFRTAFCALFGLARWHMPSRCSTFMMPRFSLTITEEELHRRDGGAAPAPYDETPA